MSIICFKTHLQKLTFLRNSFRYPNSFGSLWVSKNFQDMLENSYSFKHQGIFVKLTICYIVTLFTTIIINNPACTSSNMISSPMKISESMRDNMSSEIYRCDLLRDMNIGSKSRFGDMRNVHGLLRSKFYRWSVSKALPLEIHLHT